MDAGTSLAFTAGGTYSHAIKVTGDPTFIVGSGLSVTQSGEIDDGGGTPGVVEVAGGGSFTLTNAGNGYSGGTTVTENSTLSIADDHALGASTGDLTLGDDTTAGTLVVTATLSSTRDVTLEAGGGTIAPDAGVTASLGGDITGAGELTKTDDGTLVLTGTNDYSGGTNVFGGTLQGTTTSLQGDITDNASLVFDQSSTGTYAGDISGTGSLTKLGTGTVILAGSNNYTGGTLVSAGTLQGTTASLQGDDHRQCQCDLRPEPGRRPLAATSRAAAALTKIGAGTLIFASNNNYSGGTTIDAGVLQLGDSGSQPSFGGAVVVNGSGGLTVANADHDRGHVHHRQR